LARALARVILGSMTKRVVAAFLWFYTGWYAGALVASFLGVSPMLGPILGAAVAAVIVGDPRRIIWTARNLKSVPAETVADPV
jgi:uncharacterized protein (DUF697 family)